VENESMGQFSSVVTIRGVHGVRMRVLHPLFLAFVTAILFSRGGARADEVAWLTGKSLQQRLNAPVTVSWTNTPVAQALRSLSTAQRVAILVDRRIDPDAPIDLAVSSEPLRDVLGKIASLLSAGYTQFGPVAYFGPLETAKKLRTVAALRLEDVRRLPKQRLDEMLRLQALAWPDLAEPGELLKRLAQAADVQLRGADALPHDLWRSADLPMLSWIDRVTLLLAQFDLTFQIAAGGSEVRVTPLPRNVALVRTYDVPRQAAKLARRWAEELPGATITSEAKGIRLEGRLEDHELVALRLRGTPRQRTAVVAGREMYQLNVEDAALAQVVEQLATRLKLKVTWDRASIDAAGISVDQLITVHVKDVDLDELLKAVFEGTDLSFRRADGAVTIAPAGPAAGKP
jgi:hypothetical protein